MDKLSQRMNSMAKWQMILLFAMLIIFGGTIFLFFEVPFWKIIEYDEHYCDHLQKYMPQIIILIPLVLIIILDYIGIVKYILYLQELYRDNHPEQRPNSTAEYYLGLIPILGHLILDTIFSFNGLRRSKIAAFWAFFILVLLAVGTSVYPFKENSFFIQTMISYYMMFAFIMRLILLPKITLRPYSKSNKKVFITGAVATAAVFIFAYGLLAYKNHEAELLKNDLHAMKLPLTLQELGEYYYSTGPEVGDAPDYDANPQVKMIFEREEVDNHQRLSSEELRTFADFLEKNSAVMTELENMRASYPGKFRYNFDVDNIFEILLPELHTIRNDVRLITVQMRIAAVNGDREKVMQLYRTGNRISRALANQPMIIPGLVFAATNQIMVAGIGEVMNYEILNAADLSEIKQLARQNEQLYYDNFTNFFKGELVFLTIFDDLRSKIANVESLSNFEYAITHEKNWKDNIFQYLFCNPVRIIFISWLTQEELTFLKYWKHFFEFTNSPDFTIPKFYQDKTLNLYYNGDEHHGLICDMLLQSQSAVPSVFQRSIELNRMLQVACEIELFKLKNQRLPKDLAELGVADLPTDSANKRDFVYQQGEWPQKDDKEYTYVGYRLYGVGANGLDDGGIGRKKISKKRELDDVTLYVAARRFAPVEVKNDQVIGDVYEYDEEAE
ncbi:MAG: hypothetical protein RRY34_05230 [Victivallaceae bacterium]